MFNLSMKVKISLALKPSAKLLTINLEVRIAFTPCELMKKCYFDAS